MTDQNRQPKGTPTGGQFAASARTESDVSLAAAADPAFYDKPAADLTVGDRVETGFVTYVEQRGGEVWMYVDGNPPPSTPDGRFDPAAPVQVRDVDLSDPDEFETEVHRIATEMSEPYSWTQAEHDAKYAEYRLHATRFLTKVSQPSNISPLVSDDPRAANGRAKVGDNVIFSSPMHGDRAFEVIGKRKAEVILGHDGTSVVWGESEDTEYVIRDLTSGTETTSDLRQAGWRRIPAPGDHGPAAQRQRLDRGQ